jgi:hypothetical protein
MFGVSIPAVTTRFEMTKHDIRNGRKTGCPVSELGQLEFFLSYRSAHRPGCRVESTIFLAFHISGVMTFASPILYDVTSCFACSRPEEETKSVLRGRSSVHALPLRLVMPVLRYVADLQHLCRARVVTSQIHECHIMACSSSPRICYLGRLLDTTPVRGEVISRRGQISIAW